MNSEKVEEPITITRRALDWLAVHGNVCLGLRHPNNIGPSRAMVEKFLADLEAELLACGLLSPADIAEIHQLERQESPFGQQLQ